MRSWLGLEAAVFIDDGRPSIIVEPGRKHLEVNRAEAAILASDIIETLLQHAVIIGLTNLYALYSILMNSMS